MGHHNQALGYFQFDDHILNNLLDNYTKPFLLDVFITSKARSANSLQPR